MIQVLRNQLHRIVALAAVLMLTGCSTFNRDWQTAAAKPASTGSIEGRWEGKWLSEHNGHSGRLRALVQKLDNGQYETRFHAKYAGVLSFSMKANLNVQPAGGLWQFSGEEDLGKPYGVYRYEGKASVTNFLSTYKASFDHGTFQMTRPQP